MNTDLVMHVVTILADHDLYDEIYWERGPDGERIIPSIICNDMFFWGFADSEPIELDQIGRVKQAIKDCDAVGDEGYGLSLFVCRARKMRPQGAFYSFIDRAMWPLFDTCGPERATGPGNPYAPGEYQ